MFFLNYLYRLVTRPLANDIITCIFYIDIAKDLRSNPCLQIADPFHPANFSIFRDFLGLVMIKKSKGFSFIK